jgi:hypothetical protein
MPLFVIRSSSSVVLFLVPRLGWHDGYSRLGLMHDLTHMNDMIARGSQNGKCFDSPYA